MDTAQSKAGAVCADEPNPIESRCPACDLPIHVHPGPPFWIHDLRGAKPYLASDLPQAPSGERTLLCWDCTLDAQVAAEAGLAFVLEIFCDAQERKRAELFDPGAYEQLGQRIIALHREALHVVDALPGTARTMQLEDDACRTEDDDERLVAFEKEVLLSCYRAAQAEQREQVRASAATDRGSGVGLRVVDGANGGNDDDIPF